VFVNETFFKIMNTVKRCRLQAVQLHGRESPRLVQALYEENIIVIKALFREGSPSLDDVKNYQASAYLIECGKGPLPGGNAMQWPWETARGFGKAHPFILAGGLSAANVMDAVTSSAPDAVDVSSGVESTPGRKDLAKVKDFMQAISQGKNNKPFRRIF
jgi:phosphoribosylanthranilate isomerase